MKRSKICVWCGVLGLLLAGCGDSSPPASKDTSTPSTQKETPKTAKKKTNQPAPDSYPALTTKTAPAFLEKYGKEHPETICEVETRFGPIRIRLYEDTPIHRANFLYLANRGYYNETEFYRVAKGYVCQAGNSDSWETQGLRSKIGRYRLDPEFRPNRFHKYGAVAAARIYEGNPEKRSSAFEWYIVLGQTYNAPTLRALARDSGATFNDTQIQGYGTVGGAPNLDGKHTVFGEVISGMDAVKAINQLEVDRQEWPKEIVPIRVRVIR